MPQSQGARAEAARREMVAGMSIQDANLARVTPVSPPRALERDVPVLPGRVPVPLAGERPERLDQPRAGIPGIDDVVHVSPGRRRVGVGELARVLPAQPGRFRGGVGGRGDLILEEDLHRTLRPHDGDLGAGPRQVESPRMCLELITS